MQIVVCTKNRFLMMHWVTSKSLEAVEAGSGLSFQELLPVMGKLPLEL